MMQQLQRFGINPPRCECHECTQIRWKMSMQAQLGSPQQPLQSGQVQDGSLGQIKGPAQPDRERLERIEKALALHAETGQKWLETIAAQLKAIDAVGDANRIESAGRYAAMQKVLASNHEFMAKRWAEVYQEEILGLSQRMGAIEESLSSLHKLSSAFAASQLVPANGHGSSKLGRKAAKR